MYKYIRFHKVISLTVQEKCKNEYKIKLPPCLFKHHTMKVHKGVKITHSHRIHYIQLSHQLYAPLNRRPDGHQRRSGHINDEKHFLFLPVPEIEQFLGRPVRSRVRIPISLSRLQYGQSVVPKTMQTNSNKFQIFKF